MHPLPHVHAVSDVPVEAGVHKRELPRPHVVERHLGSVAEAPLPVPAGVHEHRVRVVLGRDAVCRQPRVQDDVETAAQELRLRRRVAAVAVGPALWEAGGFVGAGADWGEAAVWR